MTALRRLPIDQYQRYRLVADLAERMRDGERPLRVLDVGGRTGLLRRFLPGDRVVAVDREGIADPRDLVLGDGARLPFRDGAFDLVCAFDTLEHVPPEDREGFVAECLRTSRAHVCLIGPWAGTRVAEAEAELRTFLLDKLKLEHRYLEEHHEHGLPSRRAVRGWMEARGAAVRSVGQGNLQRWLALMCLEIYLEADPDLRRFAPRLYQFYNANLYASDNRPPVYRHALIAAVNGVELPSTQGLFSDSQEPPELFAALNRFLPDLLAFDRARGHWRDERQRFEATVLELRTELEAHRSLVARLRSDLDDQRSETRALEALRAEELEDRRATAAHVAHLEDELHRMAATAEELEQNRRATQVELERVLADRETVRASLEAVRADRDAVQAHRDEVAADRDRWVHAHAHAVDERNRVVAEHEDAAIRFGARLAALDGERTALRERAEHVERALAELRAELDAVEDDRSALRERAEHLERALAAARSAVALSALPRASSAAASAVAQAAASAAAGGRGRDIRANRARRRRRASTRRGRR